jgi:hypothetical protein
LLVDLHHCAPIEVSVRKSNKPLKSQGAHLCPLLVALGRMIGLVSRVEKPTKGRIGFIGRDYVPPSCGLNINGLRLVVSRQH